jgi:hypothetical protein
MPAPARDGPQREAEMRDEQIAEWIKITERVSTQSASKPQGGRPEGGVRAASRELGVERMDASRE